MLRLCPVTLVLVLITLGCGRARLENVTGTWTMKETSRQILPPELNNAQSRIVLSSDGSCTAHLVPGPFQSPPQPPRLDGDSGVWRIVERAGKEQIQLDFRVENGPFSFPLVISKGWTGITLYYFLGDPDEGLRIDFERK